MRGIVWTGEAAEVRTDVEVRAPEHDEVWVRIEAAGVCHSDASVLSGTIPWPGPSLMGHEGAGVVEAVGAGVTRVRPGDHVVVATIANCGACKWCNIGKPTWCRASISNRTEPFTVGGEPAGNFAATSSFAEVTVVKEVQAVPIPEDVPLTSACLIACGVVTGLGSVFNRADVRPGQTAAVFGAGGVGLSAIQALRIKQASRIIAVDANPAKREIALALGATDFINAREVDDVVEAICDIVPHSAEASRGPFGAGGVDWSFECVGHMGVLGNAVDCLDWGGSCVVVGQAAPGDTMPLPVTHLTQVDRNIIGSRAGGVRPQYDIPMIVDLYRRGQFDLDSIVTRTYPMEDFHTVLHDMHEGTLARGVLTF
ncbi:MAG: alcohol dehydrogenase catalytic domain-containing protein [Acidimicrobiales bacterium]|nr:alcohol dehydrogenase catalytic domain-containing protein [Acidimicrobiales bacterium]